MLTKSAACFSEACEKARGGRLDLTMEGPYELDLFTLAVVACSI